MFNYMTLLQRWHKFSIVALLLGVLVIISTAVSSSTILRPQRSLKVKNTTQALQLVGTSRVEGRIKLTLRNVSPKNINGFQILVGKSRVQVEFLDADEPGRQTLASGGIYEDWFLNESNPNVPDVVIFAVMFEDGSSDGEADMIREMEQTRQGKRIQVERFKSLLQNALAASGGDTVEVLEKIEHDILATPEDMDERLPGNVKLGLYNEKSRLLNELRHLKRNLPTGDILNTKTELIKLKERIDRRLSKL